MTTDTQPIVAEPCQDWTLFSGAIEAGTLRSWLDSIQIVDEVRLQVKTDGWYVKAVDAAHVCIVQTQIDHEAFIRYDAPEDSELFLDVPVARNMARVVKGNMTEVRVIIKERESHTYLMFEWEVKGDRFKLTRTLTGEVTGLTDPKIPDLHLPVKFTINRSQLDDLLVTANKLSASDHVRFAAKDGEILFRLEGDLETYEQTVNAQDVKVKEDCKSLFPLSYIGYMVKGLRAVDKVTVHLGNEYPITIEGERDGLKVLYMCAPRVERD